MYDCNTYPLNVFAEIKIIIILRNYVILINHVMIMYFCFRNNIHHRNRIDMLYLELRDGATLQRLFPPCHVEEEESAGSSVV